MQVASTALLVAGLAVGLAALVTLHVLPTGLSPLHNAVSQYGITSYRTGYRVQTIAYAVAGLGAALGVTTLPGSAGLLVALCAVFAASRAAISWFPMDPPGGERTTTGRRHGLLAIAAFAAAAAAAQRLTGVLHRDDIHPDVATVSNVLAVLMLIAFLGMMLTRLSRGHYFGLVERGFYVLMTAWLVTVAVLIALPTKP
jgi:hypothetical protein